MNTCKTLAVAALTLLSGNSVAQDAGKSSRFDFNALRVDGAMATFDEGFCRLLALHEPK